MSKTSFAMIAAVLLSACAAEPQRAPVVARDPTGFPITSIGGLPRPPAGQPIRLTKAQRQDAISACASGVGEAGPPRFCSCYVDGYQERFTTEDEWVMERVNRNTLRPDQRLQQAAQALFQDCLRAAGA